MLEVEKKGFAK